MCLYTCSQNKPSINHFYSAHFSFTSGLCCHPCSWSSLCLTHQECAPCPLVLQELAGFFRPSTPLNTIPSASHLPETQHCLWFADASFSPFSRVSLLPSMSLLLYHNGVMQERGVYICIYSAIWYTEARTQFQKYRDLLGRRNLEFALPTEALKINI